MDSGILHERIEAYLAGTLDPVRKAEFEEELAVDEGLRHEVDLHRQAERVLQLGLREEWKEKLKQIDFELRGGQKGRIRPLHRLAAAAAILLVIAVAAHFYTQGTYGHQAIAQHQAVNIENEVFRGTPDFPNTPAGQFAKANLLFENGDYNQARMLYLEIIQADNLLKEHAEWNLLMCYLASDPKSDQFDILIDRIASDTGHEYSSKAMDLRKTMSGNLYKLVNR